MRHHRAPRLPKAAAIVAALLLVLASLGGSGVLRSAAECCRVNAAVASELPSDDCCAGPHGDQDASEDSDSCPCPFPCALGCRAHVPSALPAAVSPSLVARANELTAAVAATEQVPSSPEPADILHVPKPVRC